MGKVVYRREKKSRSPYPLLILGAVVVFGFSLVNLVFPKRDQLELENRKAAQLPAFSVSALLDGSWQSGFARWMQDQFALRDVWVNTQRAADEIVFQKVEEGGILLGKDHWMFTKLFTVDDAAQKQLAKNVQAVSDFAAAHPGKVTFLLAPSASVIYPEELPTSAPMADENAMLDDIFTTVGQNASVLDLRPTFTADKNEYLYFKTDHHWTADGAYYAYRELMKAKGMTASALTDYTRTEYPGFIGSFYQYSNQSDTLKNNPDTVVAYTPTCNDLTYTDTDGNQKTGHVVSDATQYSEGNKYLCFICGDQPYERIDNPNITDGSSCVVIKESYGNAFVPFLVNSYQTVHVVDYRYFSGNLIDLVKENGIQDVIYVNNANALIESAAKNMTRIIS